MSVNTNNNEKHVKFAKCYVAICIPTGQRRLKHIEPEHYKQQIDINELPPKRCKFITSQRKKEHDKRYTADGMFKWLINLSAANTQHTYANPDALLTIIKNIINDEQKIVYDNKIFNLNWNIYYKYRSFIPELKTKLLILLESLYNGFVIDYLSKARKYQRTYRQYAFYLTGDEVENYKKLYDIHYNEFIKDFHNLVKSAMETEPKKLNQDINRLKIKCENIINDMKNYSLDDNDIVILEHRIKNKNIADIVNLCYSSFGDTLPISTLLKIINNNTTINERFCEAYEVISEIIKSREYESVKNISETFDCYQCRKFNPLVSRFRIRRDNINVANNFNI